MVFWSTDDSEDNAKNEFRKTRVGRIFKNLRPPKDT